MNNWRLGAVESTFADLIWRSAPLSSGALAKLAEQQIGWKKTTTYTVLKRLCDRGIFKNEGGTVSAVLTREEFYAKQSEEYIQEAFNGSLPAFLVAFGSRKKLSEGEIQELQRLIDDMRRG